MRVHAKCSLGLFVDIFVKTDLFNFCVLFFLLMKINKFFAHFFLVDSKFYMYMWCLWHGALSAEPSCRWNTQFLWLALKHQHQQISFFMFVFLPDDPLTGPDMLAFCIFHSSLQTRWHAACLSGRSEMSCIDLNCCCLIFRVKNSIAPRVPLKINSSIQFKYLDARMHPLAAMLIISSERHVQVARIRDEQRLAWWLHLILESLSQAETSESHVQDLVVNVLCCQV